MKKTKLILSVFEVKENGRTRFKAVRHEPSPVTEAFADNPITSVMKVIKGLNWKKK